MEGVPTVLIMAGLAMACSGLAAQETVRAGRASTPNPSLRIYNIAGSVRVIGWDHDSVSVVGNVGDPAGRFFMGGSPSALKLGVELPEDRADPDASNLEVRVPKASRVWIKATTAEIEVVGVSGGLDLFNVKGRIRVEGSPTDLSVETLDGNIEIVATAPSVRVKTAGGAVVLRGVIREIDASTVTGALLVGMLEPVHRVRLASLSGEISFKGYLDDDGVVEIQSHDGDVELRLPAALPADYDLSAYGGEIQNELAPRGMTLPRVAKGKLEFTVGAGTARVTVRTFKGTVMLKGK